MSTGLRPWRLRTSLRRSRTQWRLLAVVTAVATLACTFVAALGLLVSATEARAVRSALTEAEAADTDVTLRVTGPNEALTEVRAAVDAAVHTLVDADAGSVAFARSVLFNVLRTDQSPALTYVGEVDELDRHTVLAKGEWPSTGTGPDGVVPVAVPESGATALDLEVGDTVALSPFASGDATSVQIVGIYRTTDPGRRYWDADSLRGEGMDPAFSVPGSGGSVTTTAIGPLVVAPGTVDERGIRLDQVMLRYSPDFGGMSVGRLAPLLDRLDAADETVVADIGDVGQAVRYASGLRAVVQEVSSAVVVTRATVVVVSLLLVVLAVAAILQTARLLAEVRLGEQHLMRARGASGRQLLSLAMAEALGVGFVAAAASPVLARWVYQVLARQPAMTTAGMSVDPGIPLITWATAAGVALVLVTVIVSPLLRRGGSFVESEQMRARPSRRTAIQRSGLDVALLVLAGVAYWQLQTYRSPVGGGASLAIDPVLAVGPALALLAGALLCVRLVPAASRITERIGSGGRGVVAPLAAWEVGRRANRATGAVLLLTLALAVGTFSQSFLATWRQSQADQASFVVGPPVRVADVPEQTLEQPGVLADGATGAPEPTLRRTGTVGAWDPGRFERLPEGDDLLILGVTDASRDMLARGRLAEEGGALIRASLDVDTPPAAGFDLADDARGLSMTVQVAGKEELPPNVVAMLHAVVEVDRSLLTTVDLGVVPADGEPYEVRALLPGLDDAAPSGALRIVGLQVTVTVSERSTGGGLLRGDSADVEVLVKDLAALVPQDVADDAATDAADPAAEGDVAGLVAEPVTGGDPADTWYILSTTGVPLSAAAPEGWQMAMRASVNTRILRTEPVVLVETGWPRVDALPVVLTDALADRLHVTSGDLVMVVADGAWFRAAVAATTPRVPTAEGADAVVVDQTALARALVGSGATGATVDEWWVDVPAAGAEDYLTALPDTADGAPGAERAQAQVALTQELQEGPLRVATQGALWLVTLAAAVLVAIGFAVHATVTLRARAVEFAQLRAIGLTRRRLTAVIGVESLLLCVLGTVFGIGLGIGLGWLVGPLVAVSADGTPPVPPVAVLMPWADIALLAVEVAAVLALVVVVVARVQRSVDPATVLRLGDER